MYRIEESGSSWRNDLSLSKDENGNEYKIAATAFSFN